MSRTLARTLAVIAALFLAAGAYGLLATITVDTPDTLVDCGSALAPSHGSGHRELCADARDDRNLWAIPAAAIGSIGLIVLRAARRRPTVKKASE